MTKLIPIDSIVVGERLRKTNAATVEYIANSFAVVGQLQPVVCQRIGGVLHLLAGAHRLEAAQKLGWIDIEVKEIDLSGYSERMARVIVQIVEVDENLGRSDLDQSERVLFMGKRIDLTEEKIRIEREEKAEAELVEAEFRKSAAVAAEKAAKEAKNAEAVKAAKAEKEEAERVRHAAVEKLRRTSCTDKSLANDQTVQGRTQRGVIDEVAKELKLKPSTVKNLNSFRNQVGDEDLKVFAGTRFGTQSEMTALVKLKKEFPEAYDRIMKHNRRYKEEGKLKNMYSPCRELGILTKDRNAQAKVQSTKTEQGKLEHALKMAQELHGAADAYRQAVNALQPDNRKIYSADAARLTEQLNNLVTKHRQHAKPAVQKRTGTEHRYGGAGKEVEGPSRADVAKELEAHADEIEKVLKAKNKKTVKKSA